MDDYNIIKEKLYNACIDFVNERSNTIEKIIISNQKALTSETKSSAGDKHETGRAMLQLEMEKASQQLAEIDKMRIALDKIKITDSSEVVKLGSLVITNKANFFLSISAGELIVLDKTFYAVSPASPIGKLLLGKRMRDTFIMNQEIVIREIY